MITNKMLRNKYKTHIVVSLISTALLSILLAHSWPLLIFSIILLTLFLPLPQKMSSITIRILVSIMLLVSLIQIEGILMHFLHIRMNIFAYNSSIAVVLAVAALFLSGHQKIRTSVDDPWIILVPMLIVGTVMGSMLTLVPRVGLDRAIVYKTTTSTDESQHLSMFAELIDSDGNVAMSPKAYPTGWHLAMSVLTQSFVDLKDASFMHTLRAYYFTKMFSMSIVLMAIMVLFIITAKRLLKDYSSYYLLFSLGTLLLSLVVVIPNSEINAFYNFVPQYVYFLLLTSLLIAKERADGKYVYAILVFFILASFISWILSGIILMILTVSAFVSQYINNLKIKRKAQKLIVKAWQPVALIVLGAVSLVVAVPSGLPGKSVDLLEHPGGWVEGVSQVSYLVLFILLAKEIFIKQHKGLSREARVVLGTYFAIISGIVMVTTLRGYGENLSYYWQKIEMPLLLMTIPIAIISIVARVHSYSRSILASYGVVVILMILSIPSVFGSRVPSMALKSIANQDYLHKSKDTDITKPIAYMFEKNNFRSEDAVRYVFATSSNYTLDQMVYQLMSESIVATHAITGASKCFPAVVTNGGYVGDNVGLLSTMPQEYCGHKVKVVVSDDTVGQVSEYVDQERIININD